MMIFAEMYYIHLKKKKEKTVQKTCHQENMQANKKKVDWNSHVDGMDEDRIIKIASQLDAYE